MAPVAVAGAVFEGDLLVLGKGAHDGGGPAGGGADVEDGRGAGGRFGGEGGRRERGQGQQGQGEERQGFRRAHGVLLGADRNQDLRDGLVPGQSGRRVSPVLPEAGMARRVHRSQGSTGLGVCRGKRSSLHTGGRGQGQRERFGFVGPVVGAAPHPACGRPLPEGAR